MRRHHELTGAREPTNGQILFPRRHIDAGSKIRFDHHMSICCLHCVFLEEEVSGRLFGTKLSESQTQSN